MSQPALIVIDLQNDYFPDGKFPLWNAEGTLANVEQAIGKAHAKGIPVILVQHVADASKGIAPFFNTGTPGVAIHPRILAAAPEAPVVIKSFADSFHKTTLEATLAQLGVDELLVCGMMTQNCVTHTAISKAAEKYQVSLLADCCTTVSEILHKIALNAVSTRLTVGLAADLLQSAHRFIARRDSHHAAGSHPFFRRCSRRENHRRHPDLAGARRHRPEPLPLRQKRVRQEAGALRTDRGRYGR